MAIAEVQPVPTSYYYQDTLWVLFIIVLVLLLILLVVYILSKKKNISTRKKGALIGLSMGLIWFTISLIGTFQCNWNPIEGSVVPGGICKNQVLLWTFYVPTLFSLFPPVTFTLVGYILGRFIEKKK